MVRVGSKVKTLVPTQYTEMDPYSINGINHYKHKYPKDTICTVTCVNKRTGMACVVADDDKYAHTMDHPAYCLGHLQEVEND